MRDRIVNNYAAACIRALRTGIQTVLAGIGAGTLITDVGWITVVSMAGLAMIVSLLQGLLGALPEVPDLDGEV